MLDVEIQRYVGAGFRLVTRTATVAYLVRPKARPARVWFWWGDIVFVAGAVIASHLIGWWLYRDETVFLVLGEDGQVRSTNKRPHAPRVRHARATSAAPRAQPAQPTPTFQREGVPPAWTAPYRTPAPSPGPSAKRGYGWFLTPWGVAICSILVWPLAPVFLWLSPALRRRTKIAWTAVFLFLTFPFWMMVVRFPPQYVPASQAVRAISAPRPEPTMSLTPVTVVPSASIAGPVAAASPAAAASLAANASPVVVSSPVAAASPVAVARAVPAASPPPATSSQASPRPSPTMAMAAPNKSAAVRIDPRELAANPNRFAGQTVELRGTAANVEQHASQLTWTGRQLAYTWMSFLAAVPDRIAIEALAVTFVPQENAFLRGDCYRIVGEVKGTTATRNLLTGVEGQLPEVRGQSWEKLPMGSYGECLAPASEQLPGVPSPGNRRI